MQVSDVKAIVTGATSGIGLATAKTLIDNGAVVGVLGKNDSLVAQVVRELGPSAVGIVANLEEPDSISFEHFIEQHGSPNVLINNAGVLLDGPLFSVSFSGVTKYSLSDWKKTLDINLTGAFVCSQKFVEVVVMQKVRKSLIVNISSVSRNGNAGQVAYSASKGALISLTATLAKELAPLGVRAVAIAPGLVDTKIANQIPDAYREDLINGTAVKRIARPEEIAHGVVFCVENEFFDGKVLDLDGGFFNA